MDEIACTFALAVALCAGPACAADIRPPAEVDALPDDDARPTGPVATVRNPDGSYTTWLDASDDATWRRLDLETGMEADDGWDLAGRRFHLRLDGGASGDGGVEVAPVAGDLASVTAAPATGWITDAPDADGDGEVEYAFEQGDGWYAYDTQTHVLTPRPIVWVIRTNGDAVIKLAIESYYDEAGTPARFRLRWAPLGGAA